MEKNMKKGLVGMFLTCFAVLNLVFSYSSSEDKQSSLSLRNLAALADGGSESYCDQEDDSSCKIIQQIGPITVTGISTGTVRGSSW